MILDEDFHKEQEVQLSDQEIFTQIWVSPRLVFRYINNFNYDKYVAILLVLAGIANSVDRASGKNYGDDMSLWTILGTCVLAGGLFGWIGYYIYAALISWTGKWISGKAERAEVVRIIAYAAIPSILTLIFLIPQLIVFGNEVFQGEINLDQYGLLSNILFYSTVTVQVLLSLWSVWLLIIGISEVQNFTKGKAFGNLVLSGLVIIIPILLIALLLGAFS